MSDSEISSRISVVHTHKLNRLMLRIFVIAIILSIVQDFVLYFGFKQIRLSLLLFNALFMLILMTPSYLLYKRNFNPKLLGIYNVFVCMTYIAFTLINYDFSPFSLTFIAFNIIAASIYLDYKGYFLVSVFSLLEVVLFSYYPAYAPQGEFWIEVSNRLQVILFVSLFCYGVLKPSQMLLSQLLEQELQTMQMAHELRNPLTTVKGFLQLMVKKQKFKEAPFELVLEELDRANSIITDYLTLYKPLAKNLHSCDINEIILSVVKLMDTQTYSRSLVIEKQLNDGLPILCADSNQIKQVIINLVKNSIQALGNNGQILIFSNANDNNEIIITIRDNGPGFPDEILKRGFTPFFTTKQDGNGLGLPVCKKIINSHGGNIEIGNNPDKGSCVTISLPVNISSKTA